MAAFKSLRSVAAMPIWCKTLRQDLHWWKRSLTKGKRVSVSNAFGHGLGLSRPRKHQPHLFVRRRSPPSVVCASGIRPWSSTGMKCSRATAKMAASFTMYAIVWECIRENSKTSSLGLRQRLRGERQTRAVYRPSQTHTKHENAAPNWADAK